MEGGINKLPGEFYVAFPTSQEPWTISGMRHCFLRISRGSRIHTSRNSSHVQCNCNRLLIIHNEPGARSRQTCNVLYAKLGHPVGKTEPVTGIPMELKVNNSTGFSTCTACSAIGNFNNEMDTVSFISA